MPRAIQDRALPGSLVSGLALDGIQSNPELDTDTVNLVWDANQGGWLNPRKWAQSELTGTPGNVTWYFQDGAANLQGGDRSPLPENVFYVVTHLLLTAVNGAAVTANMRFRLEEEDPPRDGRITRYLDWNTDVLAGESYRDVVALHRAVFRPQYHGRLRVSGGVAGVETMVGVHILYAQPGVQIPV